MGGTARIPAARCASCPVKQVKEALDGHKVALLSCKSNKPAKPWCASQNKASCAGVRRTEALAYGPLHSYPTIRSSKEGLARDRERSEYCDLAGSHVGFPLRIKSLPFSPPWRSHSRRLLLFQVVIP